LTKIVDIEGSVPEQQQVSEMMTRDVREGVRKGRAVCEEVRSIVVEDEKHMEERLSSFMPNREVCTAVMERAIKTLESAGGEMPGSLKSKSSKPRVRLIRFSARSAIGGRSSTLGRRFPRKSISRRNGPDPSGESYRTVSHVRAHVTGF
jgi:hypothetical protein